jgi:hypothetical protein
VGSLWEGQDCARVERRAVKGSMAQRGASSGVEQTEQQQTANSVERAAARSSWRLRLEAMKRVAGQGQDSASVERRVVKGSEGQRGAAWSEQRRRANRTAANRERRRASSGEEQLALAFGGEVPR